MEAAVLLVSIKIIVMAAATRDTNKEIVDKLDEIIEKLKDSERNEPL